MPVPLTLKVFKGEELVATREFERDIIKIGRLSSAQLCLEDEKVSRIHSVIEVGADGALSIIDMGSVEGTWVNGKRVNKGALAFGDEIRVGGTTIRVENPATAQSVAALQSAALSLDATTQVVTLPGVAAPPQEAASVPVAAPAVAPVAAPPSPPAEAVAAQPVAPVPVPAPVAAPAPIAAPQVPLAEVAAVPEAAVQRPHRSQRRKGAGPLGLELRFVWGEDQIVAEHLLRPGEKVRPFTVGSAKGVNFEMGDGKLGQPAFELVRTDKEGFVVRFTGKMTGEYWQRSEVMDLTAAIESRRATRDGDAYGIAVGPDDFVVVDLGGVKVEACLQPVPKPVLVPFGEGLDFTMLNILLVLFFLAAVFVVSARNMLGDGEGYSDELNANTARIAKLIIKPPELEKKNPLLERLNQEKQQSSGEMAQKHRGDDGKAGKKDAPERSARMAPKGDPNNKDQARMLLKDVFGSKGGGTSAIFGNGMGGELKAAMGGLFGATAGDAGGMGGLGLRGSGSGGGGVGNTIGIGGIGTKGRGGGSGSYGDGVGLGMGGKKGVDIGITSSEPTVMGSLDKELIRQVIHRNRGQIRYCYESQLTRHPNLNGKVTVRFVITMNGDVSSSNVSQSTANNAELETCVAGRVRTWKFPKPKGGGVVVVTYPFIFKQSGE